MRYWILALGLCWALGAQALPLVEKQRFALDSFTTQSGTTLKEVAVGWEAYGTLNADKSNAILITHFFSGSSHAAGKYSDQDPLPGYWDAIIGPGKAIDTDKYYVLSVDTLANANAFDPHVITTGPASLNPATGKPYGLDFPVVSIRDFVNVQKALLDKLGINKLHAVVGASMGSFQALDWAVAYPDKVERMVSVIGAGQMDPWTVYGLERWSDPIKADPAWHNGHYYEQGQPKTGLTKAVAYIIYDATYPDGFNSRYTPPTDAAPKSDIRAGYKSVDELMGHAAIRAHFQDANAILYLVRASQMFLAGYNGKLEDNLAKVSAKTLFMPASHDRLLVPKMARSTYETLKKLGKDSQYQEIDGVWGHLDGLVNIQSQGQVLKDFLDK
ncbi:E22 family MetX-like putative esterase [Gallaecimonas xiamenensis]|uniref:Probable acyltransferase n=1 Tax=Gallaecimonas xiamenensis 3-C-1 TaxID=745411 RepID=K2IYY9_9GAMM|nr:homoserine O-acetyltransferase [Gallaecimonas xiamenensis]EKE68113.1 homoserine O-acetyltransferase [Gallaecimonas xiamenensis 3-C-1]